jgi:hypothetical protein
MILVPIVVALIAQTVTASPTPSPTPASIAEPSTVKMRQHVSQDRQWWMALTRHERILVVEGEIDGITNGWYRAFTEYDTKVELQMLTLKLRNADDWVTLDRQLANAYQREKALAPAFSKTFGTYVDAIDDFYARYPKISDVTVGEVMQCLSDKPWKSCAHIAKVFGSK